MEHEKLEDLRWKRIDDSTGPQAKSSDPKQAESCASVASLRQESVDSSKYTEFQKLFQKQLAEARGRGQQGLRTASALLRGPTSAKTDVIGVGASGQESSAGGVRPLMLPPCVLKLKSGSRKDDKEVGMLQLRLHYEEKPSAVFIPRRVKLENHDFSFRRFERNVSRSIRMGVRDPRHIWIGLFHIELGGAAHHGSSSLFVRMDMSFCF